MVLHVADGFAARARWFFIQNRNAGGGIDDARCLTRALLSGTESSVSSMHFIFALLTLPSPSPPGSLLCAP